MFEAEPAPAITKTPTPPSTARRTLGTWVVRSLLGFSGLGLLVGFFMPWVVLLKARGGSGFDLLTGRIELLELLFEPSRAMLLAIPLFGVGLIGGAVTGHRVALWAALFAGISLLGYGLYTLITVFLATTGVGMWIVVASALLALCLGIYGVATKFKS